jgi:SanA protein
MRRIIPATILVLLIGVAVVLATNVFIIAWAYSSIYESVETVPTAPVALVLGASVAPGGVLSPVMKERADAALRLYAAHKVSKILVSGDDGTLNYDEVYPVGEYLLSAGVPEKDIFLDYAGFDTYSSMYRARAIFNVSSMIIVSQRFHLPRALFIAHSLGLTATGLDAGQPGEYYLSNSLREIPASIKAIFDVMFARVPKYLGQQYPVTGDGSATWVGSPQMVYFPNG